MVRGRDGRYVCAAGFMLTLAAAGYVATIDNRVCTEIDEESKEGQCEHDQEISMVRTCEKI